MFTDNKYNIKDVSKFNPADYPKVVSELAIMNEGMTHISIYYKEDIIISYLKDHCIRNDWITANEKLTELITSDSFPTFHIESLFESCRKNKSFLRDFEDYIKKRFNKSHLFAKY